MSNKFDCLITGGTRNGSAAEFRFQFVDATEENRFVCSIENALGRREIACTVIVGDAEPSARLEAINAKLLAAAKDLMEFWDAYVPADQGRHINRIIDNMRAAIAKADSTQLNSTQLNSTQLNSTQHYRRRQRT